jgi:subtilase family serine protease
VGTHANHVVASRSVFPSVLAKLAAAVVAVATAPLAVAADSSVVDDARAYLAAQQRASGEFERATITDTVEALAAIEDDTVRERALLALAVQIPDNAEAALARRVALTRTPYAALLPSDSAVLGGGGFGLVPGASQADPLVLAWALRLASVDADFAPLAPQLAYALASLARADGGYGFADNPSDLALTAQVAMALKGAGPFAADAAAAAAGSVQSAMESASAGDLSTVELALGLAACADRLSPGDVSQLSTLLAARQEVSGAFDSDVRATALALAALRFASPDLRVVMPLVLETRPVTGATYAVPLTVSNFGSALSPSTSIRYTVTDAAGAVVSTGIKPVAELLPGEGIQLGLDLGAQGAPGPRLLTAAVNPDGTFVERNLGDNVASLPFEVVGLPDLVVATSDVSVAPFPPPMHQAATVTVRLRNVGSAVARDVHLQLFSGEPGAGGMLVAEQFFNAVAPGTPRLLVTEVVPYSLDPLRLVARVDAENVIPEADESNNEATLIVTPVKGAVISPEVTPMLFVPPLIAQGDTLGAWFGTEVSVFRFGDPYPVPDAWPYDQIVTVLSGGSPGAEAELRRQVIAKSPANLGATLEFFALDTSGHDGPLEFRVHADALDDVPEPVETNNTVSATVTVTTPDLPELWIDRSTVRTEPPVVEPGASFTIHGTLRNTGRRSATSIPILVAGQMLTVPALAAGDSVDVPVVLTSDTMQPGTYVDRYYVDPYSLIAESSKANNEAPVTIYVGRSDLEIASVTVDPDPVVVGGPAYVTVTLTNIGNFGEAGTVSASVRVGDATIASGGTVAYPAPGEWASLAVPVSTAGMVGDTPAVVRLAFESWTNRVVERAFVLRVRNPDFGVTSRAIQVARSPIEQSQDVQATIVVNNTGTADGTTSVRLYRGYQEQNDLVAIGTLTIPAGGSAAFRTGWFPLTSTAAELLTAVVDEENAVVEPHEDDNLAVRDLLKAGGEIVVAFDESRLAAYTVAVNRVIDNFVARPGGFADWARDLEARGFLIRTIDPGSGGITPRNLLGVDVLVVQPGGHDRDGVTTAHSSAELATIKEYLRQGGAMLYIGEWGAEQWTNPYGGELRLDWYPAQDEFLSAFGWQSAYYQIATPGVPRSDEDTYFAREHAQITAHQAMTGIDLMHGSWSGAFASAPPGASPLIRMGNGQAGLLWDLTFAPPSTESVAAAATFEGGRVAFVLESNFFDSVYLGPHTPGYYLGQNRRFALQVVDWLAGGASRDAYPDLVLSALDAPSVVTGGELVEFAVTVTNVGDTIQASGVTVRFYDGDPGVGRVIGEDRVNALNVDESERATVTWNTRGSEGDHLITAVVDPDDEVREFDDDHNSVSANVHVRDALDLRIDPSDITLLPGDLPVLTVRVHNTGHEDLQGGGRLDVAFLRDGAAFRNPVRFDLPPIAARSATSFSAPWRGEVPSFAFSVDASASLGSAPGYDADPSNDTASREITPPALEVHAPLDGSRWGGKKSVRFSAHSFSRPNVNCSIAIAPEGGEFTGVPGLSCGAREIDTTRYADGAYVLRVTADDSLQKSEREVRVRIVNAALAVREFEGIPERAAVTLGSGEAGTSVAIPVESRVVSATAVVAPVPAVATVISTTPAYDAGAELVRLRGTLHVFYVNPGVAGLWTRASHDDGATWSAEEQVGGASAVVSKTARVNANGIHLVYADADGVHYTRSADGAHWSGAVQIAFPSVASTVQLDATDEGLTLVAPNWEVVLAIADAQGEAWSPAVQMAGWRSSRGPWASIRWGKLHLFHGDGSGFFYRSVSPERYADPTAYSPPAAVVGPGDEVVAGMITGREIVVVHGRYGAGLAVQRCALSDDCSVADEWLPEPPLVSEYSGTGYLGERGERVLQFLVPDVMSAYGTDGGSAWSPLAPARVTLASERTYVFEPAAVIGTGRLEGLEFFSNPGLSPTDVTLDVGGDGASDLATPGMLRAAVQTGDLAEALNAYLATHSDASDGTSDGFITVPVSVISRGAGAVELADLEVVYSPSSGVAGFAHPPVFSPSASPGALDTSKLSVLGAGPISITDSSGAVRRTVSSTAESGRHVATFDGRDGAGDVLPSGAYPFGPAGSAVAEVEIDDIPPTVELRSLADGSYGGLAPIHGRATDADHVGTAKNFVRYVLEYSTNGGTTWSGIASSSTPADGVLGTWDTRRMPVGSATVRLTAFDRAGNSKATSRVYGVSPDAPLVPVIDSPTVAGRSHDSTEAWITVAGVAEPGTTVTVRVNGVAAGAAPCDERWSVANVQLPDGISTVTAVATREGLSSPTSQPIVIARYALTVALSIAANAPAGDVVDGVVTVNRTSTLAEPVVVRLSALDSTGAPAAIGLAPTEKVVSLDGTGSASFPLQLGGTAVREGTYTVTAVAVSGALPAARGDATITFAPVQLLSAELASDRGVYGADQLVALEARLMNLGRGPTGELQATFTVVAPSGQQTVLGPFRLSSLATGASRSAGAVFGNPPLERGVHLADVVITDAYAHVIATATTDFDVRAPASAPLAGRLLVTPPTYSVGETLLADWSIANSGPALALDVSILLLRASDGLVFARTDEHFDVDAATTIAGSTQLSTLGADGEDVIVVVLANGRGLAAQLVAGEFIDTTPPAITIQGFADGEVRSGTVTPVIVIVDESPVTSEVTLEGAPFASGTEIELDGEYVVSVHAVDEAGHESTAAAAFTIDTLAPSIAISGVTDGLLTSGVVIPLITITDPHLATSSATLDGAAYSSGTPISADGEHVLTVHATDRAGNPAQSIVRFTIDRTPPAVVVAGVTDLGVYPGPVEPRPSALDPHLATPPWTATLDGQPWTGGIVTGDGDRTLIVTATDQVGNASKPTVVRFAIDTAPPVITVAGVADGLVTRDVVTPVINVADPHLAASDVTLDELPYVSGTPISAEGAHRIVVAAEDAAGHAATVRIDFIRDTTPPSITVSGVVDGATYYVAATPTFDATDADIVTAVTGTLDGVPFASGSLVASAGSHRLEVTATDRAGNTALKVVSFTVAALQATLAGALDASARVLVALNCADQPVSCRDTQARVLLAALAEAGVPYDVALDGTTFLRKLRENRHNVRVLYRNSSSATNPFWELRELTYEGGGLVVVNDASPDGDPKLKETIGVGMGGGTSVGTLSIAAGDLGPARTIVVLGNAVKQNVVSSTVTSVGTVGKSVFATTNRFGFGRAVTLTFNPEDNDTASMKDLLVQSVRFTAGGAIPAGVPGAPQFVNFTSALVSPPGPVDMQLDVWTATGLVPLTDAGIPTTPPRTWQFPLAASAPVTRSLGVSSGQKGTYTVIGDLGVPIGDDATPLVHAVVDVTVTGSILELKTAAIAAASALNGNAAGNAVAHLNAVEPAPPTRSACDYAISQTLEATEDLKTLGTTAADARVKTDRLLRALQVLYPTLP